MEQKKIINKFINLLTKNGEKVKAIRIVNDLINQLSLDFVINNIINLKPYLEVKTIRIAGINYQIPYEINQSRQLYLSIKCLISSAKKRSEKTMTLKLIGELKDISKKQGSSIKKRDELHKLAEANRAYSNYRWKS